MKLFILFIFIISFANQAFAQNNLLSKSRKATCSEQEIATLTKDLDNNSNQLDETFQELMATERAKRESKDEKQIKKINEQQEKYKGNAKQLLHIMNSKTSFLYENCKVQYLSPKAKIAAEEFAKKRQEVEQNKTYDVNEAYQPK